MHVNARKIVVKNYQWMIGLLNIITIFYKFVKWKLKSFKKI